MSAPFKISLGVLLGIVAVIAALMALDLFSGGLNGRAARNEAVILLSAAASPEQRKEAAGHLGLSIELTDGSWIAVRYRDSHSSPGAFSESIARCSDGTWYESRVHYCALFAAYRGKREQLAAMLEVATTEAEKTEYRDNYALLGEELTVDAIAKASDLAAAKAQLGRLGFTQVRPPR